MAIEWIVEAKVNEPVLSLHHVREKDTYFNGKHFRNEVNERKKEKGVSKKKMLLMTSVVFKK